MIDETHDPARASWVGSANVHPEFPIQNLPFGVFSPPDGRARRGGVAIGDYTDFFAGIQHATNTGRLFRPDNPLLPNYKYVPVAYHGRASSVRVSDSPVRRPNGQRKPPEQPAPEFGPCRNLDYELELGVWIGSGNAQGEPIAIARAGAHVAAFCP